MGITPENWAAVRAALEDLADRFGRMVAAAPDTGKMATKDWTVAETAAHVTGIAWMYSAFLAPGETPGPIAGLTEHLPDSTVDNIGSGFNTTLLRNYTERNPQRLAARLTSSVEEMLRLTADADPNRTLSWLGGSNLPVAGVLAHLMNEIYVHGWDVSRAVGVSWLMPEEYAALFIEVFLVELIRNGVGKALDDDRPVRPGRIAVQFRSAYTKPVTIVLQDGAVSVEEPRRDNDVRVTFKPSTMDLVLFHRVGNARAAMSGALRLSGRRPWLLPAFLKKVRLP